MNFKIGGFYEMKDNGWLFVNKIRDDILIGRMIYIDADGVDEEIMEIESKDAQKLLINNICWVGKYHKNFGLYQVWDGASKSTIRILQEIA